MESVKRRCVLFVPRPHVLAGLIAFRGIDAIKPNARSMNFDRVAVDYLRSLSGEFSLMPDLMSASPPRTDIARATFHSLI